MAEASSGDVRIAIVEDEPDMRLLIRLALTRDARLQPVGEAASADEALALLGHPQLDAIDGHAPVDRLARRGHGPPSSGRTTGPRST